MRRALLLVISCIAAGAAAADASNRIRVSGTIAPSCDLQTMPVMLSQQAPGTWTGQASYGCNVAHLVVIDLGPEMTGSEVVLDGLAQRIGPDGVARIYRPQAYFGTAPLTIGTQASELPPIRIVLQPA